MTIMQVHVHHHCIEPLPVFIKNVPLAPVDERFDFFAGPLRLLRDFDNDNNNLFHSPVNEKCTPQRNTRKARKVFAFVAAAACCGTEPLLIKLIRR